MTYIIRKVKYDKIWSLFSESPAALESVPGWIIAQFIPSVRDKNGLSVFRVDGQKEAMEVAAANHFSGIDTTEMYSYIATPEDIFGRFGFTINKTPGGFKRFDVDSWHCEINVEGIDASIQLAKLFLTDCKFFYFPKGALKVSIETAARENQYDYIKLLSGNSDSPKNSTLNFIRDKVVVVSGKKTVLKSII